MSSYNIDFYGEISKTLPLKYYPITTKTHLICSVSNSIMITDARKIHYIKYTKCTFCELVNSNNDMLSSLGNQA